MKTDIGIRQIDPSSQAGVKLALAERVETEEMLEAVLVANPDMLMRGLTLVGRQVPVETGFVDLLGIDEDGRLDKGRRCSRRRHPAVPGPRGSTAQPAAARWPPQSGEERNASEGVARRVGGREGSGTPAATRPRRSARGHCRLQ